MGTQGARKCCHCGGWFSPHPRNAYHQRYCVGAECRLASKRASQRKWTRKNPKYFSDAVHVNRVRAWRLEHPGYWNVQGGVQACGPPDALQDLLMSQGFDSESVTVFRNCLSAEISQPLQDVLAAQQSVLVGLAAMISGEPLQDDIARVLNVCYQRGQRIGGVVPWMRNPEVNDERTRTDCAAPAATGSPAIQLGRSALGP